MHKSNIARAKRRSKVSKLTPISVGTQAIFSHHALHLHLLSPQFQRIAFMFSQIKQLPARRFLILVASNKNRSIWVRSQVSRIPDARPTGQHTTTGENTGWRTSQDTFALLFIAHKSNIRPGEREIALANLPLETRSQKFREQLIGIANASDQTIDINRKLRY